MRHFLDFEQPIVELEGTIEALRHESGGTYKNADQISKIQARMEKQLEGLYKNLTPWQKTKVARHPDRPHAKDYIQHLIKDFIPLAGDRLYAEDRAIIGGIGRFCGHTVICLGTEKGADTESRVRHNFGMARPDGYRKAKRLMEMADRYGFPILAFVDTAGAYPGLDAEARGQAEAIARCIETSLQTRVPSISIITGEGGSGGAVALASGNIVMMLEHSIYSVISPEGCASILWRKADYAETAAEALKLTAQDLLRMKIIDVIIPEPLGGAHRNAEETINSVGVAIEQQLRQLLTLNPNMVQAQRREKFLQMTRLS